MILIEFSLDSAHITGFGQPGTVVKMLGNTERLAPGLTLTVKRLDLRLDCFRTGVGVLAVGGTSIRSSFWLVLGVEGTEEE